MKSDTMEDSHSSGPRDSACSIDEIRILHETPGHKITHLADGTVMKSGWSVTLDEYEALKLAQDLPIPSPRVHQVSTMPDGHATISMDFIDGDMLDVVWPNMSEAEKRGICRQLRAIITSMRSLQPKTGLIASCSGGPVQDCRRYSAYRGGPFETEGGFNGFLLDLFPKTPTQLKRAFKDRMRTDHTIVFTHGDLAQHNIIVRHGQIQGLIDWEYAGWYPEYWDYVKFFERHAEHADWKEYAEDIFPKLYNDELVLLQAIARWQMP